MTIVALFILCFKLIGKTRLHDLYHFEICSQSADAQDIVDTVTVQSIEPASGASACPGQDVTINCTVIRMTSLSEAEEPTLTWVYRDIRLIYRAGVLQPTSNSLNNGVYTAVFS